MSNLPLQTLAQIVTENYRTAAVFEHFRLDFCCKGKRSLQQACEEKNLDLQEVVSQLEHVFVKNNRSAENFLQLSLTDLTDYIISYHHQYVRNEMPLIMQYLKKIAARHGGNHPELQRVAELFTGLKQELEMHLVKEEQVLFPRIRQTETLAKDEPGPHTNHTFLDAPIHVMEHEHDDAGAIMTAIRTLTNDYALPDDACTTYKLCFASLQSFEADLHHHVHLENNVLFPKAMELFYQDENVKDLHKGNTKG